MTQVVTNTRPSPRHRLYPIRENPSYKVGSRLRDPGEGASPQARTRREAPSPGPSPRKRGEGATLWFSQRKHVQHRRIADVLELRRIDELRPRRRAQARGNGEVLFAVDLEGHRRRAEAGSDID